MTLTLRLGGPKKRSRMLLSESSSALKIIAEAEMAGMLSSAGSTANVH
jgi:hypothetical protein